LKAAKGSILNLRGEFKGLQMDETIRFAWGTSSLGDFLIAASNKGLVALEFGSNRIAMVAALRQRFPEAELLECLSELSSMLAEARQAIESPGYCANVQLDLRGTAYEIDVWKMLQAIPPGKTTTYGSLASELGTRDARDVTQAIANNHIAVLVPCHRVIKKNGSISGYRWGFQRKRELLAREQRHHEFRLS
jgi:AraC family transcriptional regulator of adaptative response/methylated-DNA-[protein]-cysteine methyltransferase